VTEISRLSEHFTNAPAMFTTSPLYRSLCETVAQDPPTLELLLHRRNGQQPSFLLFGAVHYLMLDGIRHPLREFYPSLADSAADPEAAGPAFIDFCRTHRDALEELIRTRLVQTNVVKRALCLTIALRTIRKRTDRPVHLIEVGASAGIHLHFDRYRYRVSGREFGHPDAPLTIETEWRGEGPSPDLSELPAIATRIGIDLNPVDATDARQRLWLRALVWPEDQHKANLLEAALRTVADDPPTILAGDAIDVCPTLARSLPPDEPRLVFHAATRMHVPENRRARFDEAIDALGENAPLYHAWQEPASAPHHGDAPILPESLAMHGPADNRSVPLMLLDGHGDWMSPPRRPDQPTAVRGRRQHPR
jgi:hypothetical protein